MHLSKTERLILSNQYLILEELYPNQAWWYEKMRKVVEEGYALHYREAARHIHDDELSEEDCREVLHVLNMYDVMQVWYDRFRDKSGIDASTLEFPGFDRYHETRQREYAQYLISEEERFLGLDLSDDHLSCSVPMLGKYRRMLKEWQASGDELKLTRDDVIRILDA